MGKAVGLELLHSPREDSTRLVDIVFVHGLFGDRRKTWTCKVPLPHKSNDPSIRDGSRTISALGLMARNAWLNSNLGGGKGEASGDGTLAPQQPGNEVTEEVFTAFWPQNFLPLKFPYARIFTWGYDVDVNQVFSAASTATIFQHARSLLSDLTDVRMTEEAKNRPIIFIAHSLGGIVVKDALNESRVSPTHLNEIFPATLGVCFLGTPHRGSSIPALGEMVFSITKLFGTSLNPQILQALKYDAETLDRVQTAFKQTLHFSKIKVRSFRESLPTKGLIIVDRFSSVIDHPMEVVSDINASHSGMAKFATETDVGYLSIVNALSRWIAEMGPASTQHQENNGILEQNISRNIYFQVPLDTNKNYVTRHKITMALDNSFGLSLDPRSDAGERHRRVALFGLGGSGKTELAVRFAERHRERYLGVFWISGASELLIGQGFQVLARNVADKDSLISHDLFKDAQDWLINHKSWLLIIDNLDDIRTADHLHQRYLTAGMTGDVLVTSRDSKVSAQYTSIEVSDMDQHEAGELFWKIANNCIEQSEEEIAAVDKLIAELSYLPLAIDQASSYIFQTVGVTAQKYYKWYQRRKRELLNKYPSTQYKKEYGHRETVMTTWDLSFDKVKQKSTEASDLFLLMTVLDYNEIPLHILKCPLSVQCFWAPTGEFEELQERQHWISEKLLATLSDDQKLSEALSALHNFSLIRYQHSRTTFSMHRLVHYWASQRLYEDSHQKNRLIQSAIGIVSTKLEKQDLLLPFPSKQPLFQPQGYLGAETPIEEKGLSPWPLREYHSLMPHSIRCIESAKDTTEMLESVGYLCLSLLQVLEYSSLGTLDLTQEAALTLIDHIAQCVRRNTQSDIGPYFELSLIVWRLSRAACCRCKKVSSNFPRCKLCLIVKDAAFEFSRRFLQAFKSKESTTRNPRISVAAVNLDRLLRCNRFPSAFSIKRAPSGDHLSIALSPADNNESRRRGIFTQWDDSVALPSLRENSWMKSYVLAMDHFMELRSREIRPEVDEMVASHMVRTFQHLCGTKSEEYRRSGWLYIQILIAREKRRDAEEILSTLVQQTIHNPLQSWSHERCILALIDILRRDKRYYDARKLFLEVQDAFTERGLQLRLLSDSTLLNALEAEEVKATTMQIFVVPIDGGLVTIETTRYAAVRSVFQELERRRGLGPGTRLIYGGKQLDPDRLLSDYNIQPEATLHLVLRVLGG